MNRKFHTQKRAELLAKLPSGSIALINSGMTVLYSLDGDYPFEVNRNFYYFTGIAYPDMKLLFVKCGAAEKCVLAIPRVDPSKEKWTGKMYTDKECSFISGIEEVIYLDELEDTIYSLASGIKLERAYMYIDAVKAGKPDNLNNAMAKQFAQNYPNVEICNLTPITMRMRMVKTPEEVEAVREAARVAGAGFENVFRNLRANLMEHEAQACFEYVVKRNGGKTAFNSIIASGKNAVTLHYVSNNSEMKDGDLVLMDCGASLNWYNADITRTVPVNGKFTDRQREIYNIVLRANEYIIKSIKPGISANQLNALLISFYAKELKVAGLIDDVSEVSQYYYHGVSHSLGLDVHDIYDKDMPLEAGMIVTVEPGLYFEKYDIGIRIEDDVLVTAKGAEVLTNVIKKPEDIEEYMSVFELK